MGRVKQGMPFPLGVNETAEGLQFAIHVLYAKKCCLLLFEKGDVKPKITVDMTQFLTGTVYSVCFEKNDYPILMHLSICMRWMEKWW